MNSPRDRNSDLGRWSDRERDLLIRAEFTRQQLEIAISRGASRRVIEVLMNQRAAALLDLVDFREEGAKNGDTDTNFFSSDNAA